MFHSSVTNYQRVFQIAIASGNLTWEIIQITTGQRRAMASVRSHTFSCGRMYLGIVPFFEPKEGLQRKLRRGQPKETGEI